MTAEQLKDIKHSGDSRGRIIERMTVSWQVFSAALDRFTYALHHDGKSPDGIKWDENFQAQA